MPKAEKKILDALNKAISTELAAITQYMWHHAMATGIQSESVKEAFRKAGMDEMKHAEELAERLDYLGDVPTTKPGPIQVGGNLNKMIQDDLQSENQAIAMYKQLINMCDGDPTTRHLFEEILADEEGHAATWEALLST